MADIGDRSTDVSIHNPTDNTKAVTTTTNGSKEYLDITGPVTITNNESPTKYQLRTDYDATGDLLTNAADVVLFSFTGSGVVDFVAVSNATSSGYLVAIEVDSVERIRINMSDLGTNLSLTGSSTPLWVETANKNFRYHPNSEVGFTTSFRILARATGANTTVTHIVTYRERVT